MADTIQLTFVLRQPAGSAAIGEHLLAGTYTPGDLKPSDLSADSSEIQAVTDFAASNGLQVDRMDAAARTVRISGSPEAIEKALGLTRGGANEGSVEARDYRGPINLPPELSSIVTAVLGLDQRPIARNHGANQ